MLQPEFDLKSGISARVKGLISQKERIAGYFEGKRQQTAAFQRIYKLAAECDFNCRINAP